MQNTLLAQSSKMYIRYDDYQNQIISIWQYLKSW